MLCLDKFIILFENRNERNTLSKVWSMFEAINLCQERNLIYLFLFAIDVISLKTLVVPEWMKQCTLMFPFLPDRTLHNFRTAKSVDRRFRATLSSLIIGFRGSKYTRPAVFSENNDGSSTSHFPFSNASLFLLPIPNKKINYRRISLVQLTNYTNKIASRNFWSGVFSLDIQNLVEYLHLCSITQRRKNRGTASSKNQHN